MAHVPDELDDEVLLVRIRLGDEAAFETLFRRYADLAVRFSASILGEQDGAEDVMQDAFEWIWEHRAEYFPAGGVLPSLLAIVRNRSLDRVRKSKRHATLSERYSHSDAPGMGEALPGPSSQLESHERAAHVRRVIKELPEEQRTLLVLRWRHAMDWRTIAQIVGVSEESVRKQHSRAIAGIRARLPELIE